MVADNCAGTTAQHFVVGGYAPADAGAIRRYHLEGSGRVTLCGAESAVPFPTYLARRPGRAFDFAVSETTCLATAPFGTAATQTGQPGRVWFRRAGAAAPAWRSRGSGGELPTHLTMHPSGRWLVVSNYGCDPVPGSVAVFPVGAAGELAPLAVSVPLDGSGPVAERQSHAHVHSTSFTPDGTMLVAADLGGDRLLVYAFEGSAGTLELVSTCRVDPGWGPRYLHWSADHTTLYVVGELAAQIGTFAWSPRTGVLECSALIASSSTSGGVLPSDLHLSSAGDRLYVANRGAANTLAVFAVSGRDRPEPVAERPTFGRWPRHFALTADQTMVVVANQHTDDLTVLRLDDDGVPGEPLSRTEHPAPSFVGFE